MRRFTFLLAAIAAMSSLLALIAPTPGHATGESTPAFVTEIPHGYRDWKWISSAHEAGNLNSIGALLGNDIATKAYRDGKLPFPDGTMLVALHYRYVPSDENNKIFGQAQSFVPGAPTNIQFMVKDAKKVRCDRRLGVRPFRKRQTRRRRVYEKLFSLPREGQSDRSCLYSLCTLMLKARAERNETMAGHKSNRGLDEAG